MISSVIPAQQCPRCYKVKNRATVMNAQTAPAKGDIDICFYCEAISIYDEHQALKAADEFQLLALQNDTEVWPQVVQAIARIREAHQRWKDGGR